MDTDSAKPCCPIHESFIESIPTLGQMGQAISVTWLTGGTKSALLGFGIHNNIKVSSKIPYFYQRSMEIIHDAFGIYELARRRCIANLVVVVFSLNHISFVKKLSSEV